MLNYEVTFIVDPVLSGDEIKTTAQGYKDLIANEGADIVHTDEMGLKQLAYPINKRSSGVYYSIEFKSDAQGVIPKLELALRRDERIMRFLSIGLDKYGVKYNQDKRDGKIGKSRKDGAPKREEKRDTKPAATKPAAKPVAKPAPTPAPEPVVAASEEE